MEPTQQQAPAAIERTMEDLVFIGFNSRVVALDRYSGEIVWQWKAPRGRASFVALLLDGDRLIVSVQGFTYCLAPMTGEVVWSNPLNGLGLGIPALVSVNGASGTAAAAAASVAAQQQQAAAASAS